MFKPRETMLREFVGVKPRDPINDEQRERIKESGYLFLTYLAEASGIYENRTEYFNDVFSAEDEARVIF